MTQHSQSRARRAQATVWAALSLALIASTCGALTVANAQGAAHGVQPAKSKACSSSNPCLEGSNTGDGAGIEGTSASYYGILGESTGQNAAVGGFSSATSAGASGIFGTSNNGFGVYGATNSSAGYGLVSQGNALVEGLLYTSGDCKDGCTDTRHQASFAARTSEPTIDDVGEGILRAGEARVALAPDFANTIDTTRPYVVLLTPEGDAALYVTNRTSGGFEVRQVGGGHASVAFAYRIVAKPYGARNERLPFKTIARPAMFPR